MGVLERLHLEILKAVDSHGTLTAAAESLHLTQSALSHSIIKLEGQLGVELWHREGRNLRPTKAGEYLLATAHRLVPQFDEAEERLRQFARGERGTLKIGMECHPCYQWLTKVAAPFLAAWPTVDLDVRQKFQFGGLGALFAHEIDLLITPDPLFKPGLQYVPVFDYEQVLVVGPDHPLKTAKWITPVQLVDEVLFTYPVTPDRLDIYTQFLTPAGIQPRRQKAIETTEIMIQLVASGRGVAALPRWLVEEFAQTYPLFPVRLGEAGVAKQIFVGYREPDAKIEFVVGFLNLARQTNLART